MSRPTEAAPAIIYKDGSDVYVDGEVFTPGGAALTKATGADINTGTDDAKYVTPKAITDSALPTTAVIYSATVTLTDAQIKALPSTFPEIVAAPGANKVIKFESGFVSVDCQAGAYTNVDVAAAQLSFYISDQVSALCANSAAYGLAGNLLTDDSDVVYAVFTTQARVAGTVASGDGSPGTVVASSVHSGRVRSLTDAIDTPLIFGMENASAGDLTGGHADNVMIVRVNYTIIDLAL